MNTTPSPLPNHYTVEVLPQGLGGKGMPEAHLYKNGLCDAMRTRENVDGALDALAAWVIEYCPSAAQSAALQAIEDARTDDEKAGVA